MGELYGEYNLLTNEWTDGLASSIIRTAVADTTLDRKWVVFDGPVDAVWIENMNTGKQHISCMLFVYTALHS
jgi:dynein heavy chain